MGFWYGHLPKQSPSSPIQECSPPVARRTVQILFSHFSLEQGFNELLEERSTCKPYISYLMLRFPIEPHTPIPTIFCQFQNSHWMSNSPCWYLEPNCLVLVHIGPVMAWTHSIPSPSVQPALGR
jgi:hypothetical protein